METAPTARQVSRLRGFAPQAHLLRHGFAHPARRLRFYRIRPAARNAGQVEGGAAVRPPCRVRLRHMIHEYGLMATQRSARYIFNRRLRRAVSQLAPPLSALATGNDRGWCFARPGADSCLRSDVT